MLSEIRSCSTKPGLSLRGPLPGIDATHFSQERKFTMIQTPHQVEERQRYKIEVISIACQQTILFIINIQRYLQDISTLATVQFLLSSLLYKIIAHIIATCLPKYSSNPVCQQPLPSSTAQILHSSLSLLKSRRIYNTAIIMSGVQPTTGTPSTPSSKTLPKKSTTPDKTRKVSGSQEATSTGAKTSPQRPSTPDTTRKVSGSKNAPTTPERKVAITEDNKRKASNSPEASSATAPNLISKIATEPPATPRLVNLVISAQGPGNGQVM